VTDPAGTISSGGPGGNRPILEVANVHKSYGGVAAVAGATLTVEEGTLTALIGPNGAGKTTLFDVVSGFVRGDRGQILYDGTTVFRRPPYVIARRGMVRTFQLTRVLSAMSVLDNMMLGAAQQSGESVLNLLVHPRAVCHQEAAVRERARELLGVFGLEAKAGDYAGTLSGGQRKLLELARALMMRPRLVLLDEPMAGINPTLGLQLFEFIHRLRAEEGVSFLFVEHDMDAVMSNADHVIVMADGRVIAEGVPDAVRRDPVVVDAYLGRAHS
jgi:neutral amino acid transport system ATP-binding protein